MISNPEMVQFKPLKGGVSSAIWKVREGANFFCVKKALPRLKVKANWKAPIERNLFEAMWCNIANELVPGIAPKIIFHDQNEMLFAMEYFNPKTHKLWKNELSKGRVNPLDSKNVGEQLSKIHGLSAKRYTSNRYFPKNKIFQAIRLEPYLEATAKRHPDLRETLFNLSKKTSEIRITMIHGDISPKNILIGPQGPVFLDAECACVGDPAFDLAFCLNHFLLKCLLVPSCQDSFLACFSNMKDQYLKNITWESETMVEKRTAILLPALFLARVDGKSPVAYIKSKQNKDKIRQFARKMLKQRVAVLNEIRDAWKEELIN